MHFKTLLFSIFCIPTFVFTSTVNILPKIQGHVNERFLPGVYMVEFKAESIQTDSVKIIKDHFKQIGFHESRIFIRTTTKTKFFNGHSFEVKGEHDRILLEDHLVHMPDVLNIYRVHSVMGPKPIVHPFSSWSEQSKYKYSTTEPIHNMTGVNRVRSEFSFYGKSIKVAVIDSGVYYLHPALGGCFGKGCKVSFGYDFVGDVYGAKNQSVVIPDSDPIDDCSDSSHGTHVAGIIAANANLQTGPFATPISFTGVAPEVTIGAYRVFGCPADFTGDDIIAAAIFRAAKDGAKVINLSLGGSSGFSDEISSVAASRVAKSGHFVVCADGNSGAQGLFSAASPAVGLGALGIASFDNLASPLPTLSVGSESYPYAFGLFNKSFNLPETLNIVINNPDAIRDNVLDDGCSNISNATEPGQTLLMRACTGVCGSFIRCTNAFFSGYSSCMTYACSDNDFQEYKDSFFGTFFIPSVFTDASAGAAILADLSSKVTITSSYKNFPLPTAGTISSFSSGGLTPDLFIKPDIGGIGGSVFSTISPAAQQASGSSYPYAVYSGTSMAAPYVSGCIALLLQGLKSRREKSTTETVKSYLQNTATISKLFGSNLMNSVALQGAGLVNVYKALTTKTLVAPQMISLNDTDNTNFQYIINITNLDTATKAQTYTISSVGAATFQPFISGDESVQSAATTSAVKSYAGVTFTNLQGSSTFTVTVGSGKTFSVKMKFKSPFKPTAGEYPVYSGYIAVTTSKSASPIATVPFAGMVGSWTNAPVWSRVSPSFDATLSRYGLPGTVGVYKALFNASSGLADVSLAAPGDDLVLGGDAYLNLAFATNTRYLEIAAISEATNERLIIINEFNARRSSSVILQGGVLPPILTPWDGTVKSYSSAAGEATSLTVPSGSYKIQFKALRQFKKPPASVATVDASNDSDYDILTVGPFQFTYPSPSSAPSKRPSRVNPSKSSTVAPSKKPVKFTTGKPVQQTLAAAVTLTERVTDLVAETVDAAAVMSKLQGRGLDKSF